MSKTLKTNDNTFYGHKISDYGIEHHRVDYGTLASVGNLILCNDIPDIDPEIFENEVNGSYWNKLSDIYHPDDLGEDQDPDDLEPAEIYQYFLIDDEFASVIKYWTNDLILYSNKFRKNVWCIEHYGTGWDYVLTSIKIEEE